MRGLVFVGALGLGLLWGAGCAVGITGDPTEDDDGGTPTVDGSASATTTRPDGSSSPQDATPEAQPPADVIVPPLDSGGDSGGCSGGLVINEVQTESATNANHEFVEIYNPNTCDVPLEGWTLKYSAASGSTPSTFFTGLASHKVLAKGYFVVACDDYTTVAKSATYPAGQLAAENGQVGLFNKIDAQVDAVGYGSITMKRLTEGNAATTPGAPPRSVQRTPNGADTNNNQVDFRAATPSPNGPTL